MSELKHRRDHVWLALFVSFALAAFVLWFLSARAEKSFRKGEESYARCSALSDPAAKPACFRSTADVYRRAVLDFPFRGKYYAALGCAFEASGDAAGAEREHRKARLLGYRK